MARFLVDADGSAVLIDGTANRRAFRRSVAGVEGFVDVGLDADGSVDLDRGTAAELILPVDGIRGRNPFESRTLRRRIHARRFPAMGARLEALQAVGGDGSYRVRGQVTVRGRTRPAEDTVRLTLIDAGTLQIEGVHRFDIREFDVEPPRVLIVRLDPWVVVTVNLIARRRD